MEEHGEQYIIMHGTACGNVLSATQPEVTVRWSFTEYLYQLLELAYQECGSLKSNQSSNVATSPFNQLTLHALRRPIDIPSLTV